jgi:hypothetical protein
MIPPVFGPKTGREAEPTGPASGRPDDKLRKGGLCGLAGAGPTRHTANAAVHPPSEGGDGYYRRIPSKMVPRSKPRRASLKLMLVRNTPNP